MSKPSESTLDLAINHHRAGRLLEAVYAYREVLKYNPKSVKVYSLLASAQEARGDRSGAQESLRVGIRLDPQNPALRRRLALLLAPEDPDQAVQVWEGATRLVDNPKDRTAARLELIRLLSAMRRTGRAVDELRALLRDDANCLPALVELARLCDRLGRDSEAWDALQRALSISDSDPAANMLMARLQARKGLRDEARGRLVKSIANTPTEHQGPLWAELGRVLESLEDYPAAFDAAQHAHTAATGNNPPDLSFLRVVKACKDYDPAVISARPAPQLGPPGPILLVGFPRSGTTLIEQMLSAHPRFVVTDELPILQDVREQMFAVFQPGGKFPGSLDDFPPEQVLFGRDLYFRRIKAALGPAADGKRIVDKNPLNIPDLVTAKLLFPESPIIYVQRDPRDACISCFLQAFTRGVPLLSSLDGIVRFYGALADLWKRYKDALGMKFIEVRYEELVRDPATQARKIVDFLGEKWDDSVLAYHDPSRRRYITTPSYRDVSRPVYSSAIGRWKKYKDQLAPVMPMLTAMAEHLGYGDKPAAAPAAPAKA